MDIFIGHPTWVVLATRWLTAAAVDCQETWEDFDWIILQVIIRCLQGYAMGFC